jgi:hypothetical protein
MMQQFFFSKNQQFFFFRTFFQNCGHFKNVQKFWSIFDDFVFSHYDVIWFDLKIYAINLVYIIPANTFLTIFNAFQNTFQNTFLVN